MMSSPKIPKPPKPPPPPPSISDPQIQQSGAFLRFQLRPQGLWGATRQKGGSAIQRGKASGPTTITPSVRGS
jgi:hypothetical protein